MIGMAKKVGWSPPNLATPPTTPPYLVGDNYMARSNIDGELSCAICVLKYNIYI